MPRSLTDVAEWRISNVLAGLLLLTVIFGALGLFAWWAFTWSTHTIVWTIFIFGSLLGSIRVKAS